MKTNETKLLSIALGLIVLSAVLVMLALSTISAYADDGYPAPIDTGYPEPGYPVYYHYPAIGYPEPLPCYPIDYPVIPIDPLYPEPVIQPSINPVQLEPITPQYRNGRNLWQEIVYQFGYLLELMK